VYHPGTQQQQEARIMRYSNIYSIPRIGDLLVSCGDDLTIGTYSGQAKPPAHGTVTTITDPAILALYSKPAATKKGWK